MNPRTRELRLRHRIDTLTDRCEALESMLAVSLKEEERLAGIVSRQTQQIKDARRSRDEWKERAGEDVWAFVEASGGTAA